MADCDWEVPGLREYMKELEKKANDKKIPLKGIFELTPRCNFNCNMCYVHLTQEELELTGKRELTGQEWISLAQSARKAGMMELTLTGGEIFMHPDFNEIYDAISQMGFLIQIFSNGFLWTEDVMNYFAEKPPYAVRFTLYGASDETYERVCGIKNGFTKVMSSIRRLKEAGIPLYLAATITKENEKDLQKMVRLAYENGILLIHTSNLISPVRGASAKPKEHQLDLVLPPEEIRQSLRETGRYPRKPVSCIAETCGNYRKAFWITWEGNMQLCTFLSEPAIPVTSDTFLTAWQQLVTQVEQLRSPKECDGCRLADYCDRCPGTLYAEEKAGMKLADTICRRAEYQFEIYKKD